MSENAKIVSIPKNGQICLGKRYAGKNARIEFLGEDRVVVTFGQFISNDMVVFFTDAAKQKLDTFGKYEKKPPPKNTIEGLKALSHGKKKK